MRIVQCFAMLCTAIPLRFYIAQGMLAELHNAAMQVNMRGVLSDDYRIRHPNTPKMVQWHSGQDSCNCDSCCGLHLFTGYDSHMTCSALLAKYQVGELIIRPDCRGGSANRTETEQWNSQPQILLVTYDNVGSFADMLLCIRTYAGSLIA